MIWSHEIERRWGSSSILTATLAVRRRQVPAHVCDSLCLSNLVRLNSEAATRTHMRLMRSLGRPVPPPPSDVEGGKHVGRVYDRLNGTGYL